MNIPGEGQIPNHYEVWLYVMDWMFVFPQKKKFHVEILKPDVMVLSDGVFGRWLDHEYGVLTMDWVPV